MAKTRWIKVARESSQSQICLIVSNDYINWRVNSAVATGRLTYSQRIPKLIAPYIFVKWTNTSSTCMCAIKSATYFRLDRSATHSRGSRNRAKRVSYAFLEISREQSTGHIDLHSQAVRSRPPFRKVVKWKREERSVRYDVWLSCDTKIPAINPRSTSARRCREYAAAGYTRANRPVRSRDLAAAAAAVAALTVTSGRGFGT